MNETLQLKSIPILEKTSREIFQTQFMKPNKPVIMKDFSESWAARKRWTLDYFKREHGDLMVPVYEDAFANTGASYTSTDRKMRFGDYVDLIASKPTKLRMFLFNIFKHVLSLCQDFDYPNIADRFLKKYPFMFFGGAGSHVDVHYDLDLSHVYLTQFHGKKRVILFAPECSDYLYRHPLTVSCNIDIGNPDFNRYPRLKDVTGYECILEEGDTLFIPSGWWHYIYYIDGGFSLSLRSRPENLSRRLFSLVKIFNLTILDHTLSKIFGAQKWYDKKEQMAIKKAKNLPPFLTTFV